MARKSSKTAHVMNLLAGGEAESSKSEAAKENLAASQAAESKGTIKELTVLAQQASIQMQDSPLSPSPISIIDLSSSVQDPVAELIKQQLEEDEKKELGNGFSEKNEDESLPDTLPDPVSDNIINNVEDSASEDSEEVQVMEFTEPSDNFADKTDVQDLDNQNESSISDVNAYETDQAYMQDSDESEQSDIAASEESTQSDNMVPDETAQPDDSVSDELTEPDQISDELTLSDIQDSNEPIQPDIQDSIEPIQPDNKNSIDSIARPVQSEGTPVKPDPPVTDTPATPKASTFKYLNVMEHVVENIARDYIGRLGGCTCEHCIADVTALTLNKLTPKYVVVEPPAASPLLNFYSSRFAPQVIVELTKSCFIVKQNPHH
ncbi:late competence development ComFB family protein [Lacrimispora sp.]|uniref:late competence development ComFB family protein n=1 Tax=Lacrimispora sp. TaxID=2719234 RepID=UPI0032E4C47E